MFRDHRLSSATAFAGALVLTAAAAHARLSHVPIGRSSRASRRYGFQRAGARSNQLRGSASAGVALLSPVTG